MVGEIHPNSGEYKTCYEADAATAWGLEDMELRCRVCNINISWSKLGNKARNANKPGAMHTPSLRLDFLATRFVSRQKVEKENKIADNSTSVFQSSWHLKHNKRNRNQILEPHCPEARTLRGLKDIGTAEINMVGEIHSNSGEYKTCYEADAAPAWGLGDMELRCRVGNINTTCHKLGNKARNVNKPGA